MAQAQLGQELSQSDNFLTLQTDGTTKFHEHHATYDISTNKDTQSYCLGLRHIFSGSADDTLQVLKEILDDIDSVQKEIGESTLSDKILLKIKNTMSDRHAAEKKFNAILEEYRADILPTVVENWDELSEVEHDQLTRMNNFFCGLHFLVGLADCAENTLKLWETSHDENSASSASLSTSSGTQRLIRTACKAFHH